MSQRIEIANGADRGIFAAVRKRRCLKSRSNPSATSIRSSSPQISRCMQFRGAIWSGRLVSMRLLLYPQSSSLLHFRQSTTALQKSWQPTLIFAYHW